MEELLVPSIADVAVLSVDVNEEAVRIEARSTVAGVDALAVEAGLGGFTAPTCGFLLMR
ncbi:hypothetical protein ACN6LM_006236 [Streptomyces sp. SAS_281]|uniref:hypothetical protein n=1 Tax=Streptomyces sp. SAS_281 TaxID=3412744 RepID=UPI00403CFCB3